MSEGKVTTNYELACVINGKNSEQERDETLANVKSVIERFEGTIEKVDDWGKRRLAYEISRVREGYYYFITFSAPNSSPAEIEKRLRIIENILRFLIVKVED